MGSVHFIGGEKGGVGKSFTARLLAQYFIDHNTPFQGFDTDLSHATFSRFYSEYATLIDIKSDSNLDRIIEACVDYPDHNLIIDLAAQSFQRLNQWIEEGDIFSLFVDVDIPVYFWFVLDDGADSCGLLEDLMDKYSESDVQFVVVQNNGRGEYFDALKSSAAWQKAQSRNAHLLVLDKLQPELAQKIDFNNLSFWAAANSQDNMSIIQRKRVNAWLSKSYQQIDSLWKSEQLDDLVSNTDLGFTPIGSSDFSLPS